MSSEPNPLSPAIDATIDQLAAKVRDTFDHFDIDIEDKTHRIGILATWLLFAENQPQADLMLLAISRTLGLDQR